MGYRLQRTAHTSRPWRIHEVASDFEVEDVWALPTPGGPDDLPRLVSQLVSKDVAGGASLPVRALFAARDTLGRVLGWDAGDSGVGARVVSLRERLPADLRAAPVGPDFPDVGDSVFLLHDEWAVEGANRTVHGVMHIGWVPDGTGVYRGQLAVLVKPNGRTGAAYMSAIKPIRRLLVYPALVRRIGRDWRASDSSRPGDGRVRRVSVADPVATAEPYDYADAFELRLEEPDRCSPEEWVRAGVDATPPWLKRIAGHKEGLGSARIVESGAGVVVLKSSDALMDTVMIGRNVAPERRVLTTVLRYRRPLLTRAVWAVVGILHRWSARRLVAGGLR